MADEGLLRHLGVVTLPYRTPLLIELAQTAERCGFDRVGMADSPILYGEIYPSITAVLAATSTIRVGPNVTNPVSRHWTVHASTARTMDEMHPGRFFLGIAAGDGAVHTVGLKPATRPELESAVRDIRANIPSSVTIHMAASGPKTAAVVGAVADTAIIATGADGTALANLAGRARAASSGALSIWGLAYVDVVADASEVEAARERALPIAMSMSRFALADTFADKHVPDDVQSAFRARMGHYDFMHHAADGVNPNVALFDDAPAAREYLRDRFCIVGTADHCIERLAGMVRDGGLDGVWMAMNGFDPSGNLERLAAAVA